MSCGFRHYCDSAGNRRAAPAIIMELSALFLVNWPAAPLVPSHAEVLELQGTGGTSCFHQRLFLVRLVGLIFIQAME
jgi:hypothetical protein